MTESTRGVGGHVPTRPHRTSSAHRPACFTPAWAAALRDLERQFGVHLVVYINNDTTDEHGPALCQLYRKAHYGPDLARQLTALEHEMPDTVAIVAYHKPWQHEPTTPGLRSFPEDGGAVPDYSAVRQRH